MLTCFDDSPNKFPLGDLGPDPGAVKIMDKWVTITENSLDRVSYSIRSRESFSIATKNGLRAGTYTEGTGIQPENSPSLSYEHKELNIRATQNNEGVKKVVSSTSELFFRHGYCSAKFTCTP